MNGLTEETLRDALRADAGDVADIDDGWADVRRVAERRRGRNRGIVLGASATVVAAAAAFGGIAFVSDDDSKLEVGPEVADQNVSEMPWVDGVFGDESGFGAPCTDGGFLPTIYIDPELPEPVARATADLVNALARCDLDAARALMAPDFTTSVAGSPEEFIAAMEGSPHLLGIVYHATLGPKTEVVDGKYVSVTAAGNGQQYQVGFDAEGNWSFFEFGPGSASTDTECSAANGSGVAASNPDFSDAAIDTANQIIAAAAACDFDALRALMFGDFNLLWDDVSGPDAVIERWQQDPSLLATIANVLHTGEVLTENEGHYVDVVYIWSDPTGALPYRIGIGDDGRWLFAAAEAQPSCSASAPEDVTFTESPPAVVVDKATAIMDAAAACDFDGLRDLMHENFSYSLGASNDAGGAIAQWQGDPSVLAILVERLHGGIATSFTSPGPPEVTYYEWADPQSEYGYRVGITVDGEWVYFVAGD